VGEILPQTASNLISMIRQSDGLVVGDGRREFWLISHYPTDPTEAHALIADTPGLKRFAPEETASRGSKAEVPDR
jgi:hypothetical protein